MTDPLNKEVLTASDYKQCERKPMQGVIGHLGTQWILMSVEAFQGMMTEVNKIFGTGASVVWHLAGKGAGKSLANLMGKKAKSDSILDVCKKIAELYERCGWGKVQPIILRQKTSEFLIRIYNNAFARGIQSQTLSCYYIKGLLEGILEQLIGKHARSEETKCISKGDPYCEFILVLN
jgi:predicted hydrocarbon binding protein